MHRVCTLGLKFSSTRVCRPVIMSAHLRAGIHQAGCPGAACGEKDNREGVGCSKEGINGLARQCLYKGFITLRVISFRGVKPAIYR